LKRTESGDISKLLVWGQQGLLEFIILLGWWGLAIKDGDTKQHEAWLEAVADLKWVLDRSAA
jgi:hypothetical protein